MAVKFNFKGSEKFGYKVSDIEKLYAETVANYIEGGYRISLEGCSSGSQSGEINHVDFTDGRKIIRITIIEDRLSPDDPAKWWENSKIWSLKILEFEDGYGRDVLWDDKGKELVSVDFYNIGKSDYDKSEMFFVQDLSLYREIKMLHRERQANLSNTNMVVITSAYDNAVRIIRRERGFARVRKEDITVVYRHERAYCVVFDFKGKRYARDIHFPKVG